MHARICTRIRWPCPLVTSRSSTAHFRLGRTTLLCPWMTLNSFWNSFRLQEALEGDAERELERGSEKKHACMQRVWAGASTKMLRGMRVLALALCVAHGPVLASPTVRDMSVVLSCGMHSVRDDGRLLPSSTIFPAREPPRDGDGKAVPRLHLDSSFFTSLSDKEVNVRMHSGLSGVLLRGFRCVHRAAAFQKGRKSRSVVCTQDASCLVRHICISRWFCIAVYFYICMSISVCLYLYVYICMSISVCLYLYFHICISISVFLYLYF